MKRSFYRWRIVGGVSGAYLTTCPVGLDRQIQLLSGDSDSKESKERARKDKDMMIPRPNWITRLATPVRGLGPYAAIELILPGGSLIALSLWAIRHRAWFAAQARGALSRTRGRPSS